MANNILDTIDFNEDYYTILGIDRDDLPTGKDPNSKRLANDILRTAYRKKLFEAHPDRPGGDAELCKLVLKAHRILGDPIMRRVYDNGGIESNAEIVDGELKVNWDRLGKYRKGSLADMIGSALFDKIVKESGIENLQIKFQPEDETLHNYHWEFTIEGLPKDLVLSIVEDENEILKLTQGDQQSINKALPFKIYICLPSIKLVMVREEDQMIETKNGYLDTLRGKIQNARFIDADIMGTTNYENAVDFIQSGQLKEAVIECINGNVEKFLMNFKQKPANIEVNKIMQQQEVNRIDQSLLKALLEQAKEVTKK